MRRRVDLHTHSTISDGTLTPRRLVEEAAARGLAAIALTDHDHVGGLDEAREAGARLGVEIVAGIELSAVHGEGEVHLLGYAIDDRSPPFLAALATLRAQRDRRARRIVERLEDLGIRLTYEDVLREVEGGAAASVGRPHVARALVRAGHAASIQQAFDRWLGEGRAAYVPKTKLTTQAAVRLVQDAGGVAVLAHPVTVPDAERVARSLAAEGLDGIEVQHSKHGALERARFLALAEELGILATGGSDFHGENKPDVELATGRDGNVDVGTDTLEAIKRRVAARRRGG